MIEDGYLIAIGSARRRTHQQGSDQERSAHDESGVHSKKESPEGCRAQSDAADAADAVHSELENDPHQ